MTHPVNMDGPTITEVREYEGQTAIRVSPTQLSPTTYSTAQAKKIVGEWCDFLSAGSTPIFRLAFTSRTPKRLFESLAGQPQLTALSIKWGDYESLAPLAHMSDLQDLWLGGASSVRSVAELASLKRLRNLAIEELRHVHNLSPIGRLTGLVGLELGGAWQSPRRAHVDSLAFLRQLVNLERLALFALVVDDLDYSPLLNLRKLNDLRVGRARGMQPSWDELVAALPSLKRNL